MKKIFSNFYNFLKSIKDYIDGNFAYENYLKHHQKNHNGEVVLSKKMFLKNMQKDKWNRINRCC